MNDHRNSIPARGWLIIPLLGIIGFGIFFINFSIVPVKSVLEEALHLNSFGYGLVLASYSIMPVFFLSTVIAGFLADRWSILKMGSISVLLIFISTLISLYALTSCFRNSGPGFLFLSSFLKEISPESKLIMLNFLVLGAGGESFFVIINKILSGFFPKEKLPFAMALCYMITRFGMQAVFIIIPMIALYFKADMQEICYALFLGNFLIAGIGLLLFAAIPLCIGRNRMRSVKIPKLQENDFWFQSLKKLLINRQFLLLAAICLVSFGSVTAFIDFSEDYLFNKYNYSIQKSSLISSIIIMGFILFAPVFGWYLDKGKNLKTFLKAGTGIYAISFILLHSSYFNPIIALSLMAISFSLIVVCIWPLVPEMVEEKHTGLAFGFMYWLQNLGFFFFPVITGALLDVSNKNSHLFPFYRLDYYYVELLFVFLTISAFLLSLFLKNENLFAAKKMMGHLRRITVRREMNLYSAIIRPLILY